MTLGEFTCERASPFPACPRTFVCGWAGPRCMPNLGGALATYCWESNGVLHLEKTLHRKPFCPGNPKSKSPKPFSA